MSSPTSPPRTRSRNHSRTSTASSSSSTTNGQSSKSSSYFTFPVTYSVNGLLRRLSGDTSLPNSSKSRTKSSITSSPSQSLASSTTLGNLPQNTNSSAAYTPAPMLRTSSPFQPPPLTPLSLFGYRSSTSASAKLLSKSIAEEIRLLVPARLQLVTDWQLIFSLEQDGVSLNTLYQKCDGYRGKRGGYVLVVRDGDGSVFGAFLTDAPHPSPSFYGTGECFLWKASLLPSLPSLISSLPPPPSADTTNATRQTTVSNNENEATIRFKAFPYSGINDYMIFCENRFLSVGGGDGHYGLWLNDNLERGVSEHCPTFGNEPLSEEGRKFDVLGVEIWYIGS